MYDDRDHIVKSFDEELQNLFNLVARMGGLTESMLADAVDALKRRDPEHAGRVIETDRRVDDLEIENNHQTMRLLALRQPVAQDLRQVVTALKTAGDLERIGDYASNIAKRTVALSQTPPIDAVNTIGRMGQLVQVMIKDVLDAYLAQDLQAAIDVRLRDEEVDSLYNSMFRELLTYMMEDARNITACTHLVFVAKNVERIGDLATNIAEHIMFMVEGVEPENDRPKGDDSSYTVIQMPREAGS